jgi:SAM-dependent MidA family methyltransferase
MQRPFELPEPAADEAAHGARVAAHIRERIHAAGGWVDFADFMQLALYAPGLGYYSAGATKLGAAGDFVTAPEVSPLFARCLARVCAPLLAAQGGGVVLELGGGSGALAAELLEALASLGAPPERYLMLEVSADLRERQRATLAQRVPAYAGRVEWLDALPARPVRGVLLANEVADALPVSRFAIAAGGVAELGVVDVDGRFAWQARAAPPALAAAIAHIEAALGTPLQAGYVSEVSLRLPAWISALGASLREGAILIADYGATRREYYHPERRDGTLVCHYRHRAHADALLRPGLQDVTAWVDFTAVAEAAGAAGLDVAGYATQAHFLIDAGIEHEVAAAGAAGDTARWRAAQEAQRLLLPGEMGERFKVMALTRGPVPIPGFGFRDLRDRL